VPITAKTSEFSFDDERTKKAAAKAHFGHRSESSRQKQNDRLGGEKINDGCDRASRTGRARRECGASPKSTPGGATGASTASARRPQAATQLQHSDRESEVHFRMPFRF
jgi:hypothetical protein